MFNLRAHGWAKQDREVRVADLLERVGLSQPARLPLSP